MRMKRTIMMKEAVTKSSSSHSQQPPVASIWRCSCSDAVPRLASDSSALRCASLIAWDMGGKKRRKKREKKEK